MKESKVRKAGDEKGNPVSGLLPGPRQSDARNAPEASKRTADDEWLAFAAEDPAFFIKPSDSV